MRLTTDTNGNVVAQEGHFPFGEPRYQSGAGNKWFFTSYNRDPESGLDYAMARYYNSGNGAFSLADPLAGKPGDPQSWNRYAYGRNDPIDITDPSGKSWLGFFTDLISISIAASGDPVAALMWGLDQTMASVANGSKSPTISAGSMALGAGFNGGSYGNTGDLGTNIQKALGLPTMDDINPIISDATNNDSSNNNGPPVPPHPSGVSVNLNIVTTILPTTISTPGAWSIWATTSTSASNIERISSSSNSTTSTASRASGAWPNAA